MSAPRIPQSHRYCPRAVRLVGLLLTVLGISTTGCTSLTGIQNYLAYNDVTNDFVLGWRNRAWANQAWYARRDGFVGQPYLKDFGEGFRAGYADVAAGGNGCTPALPPRKYWSWKYQTAEGQGKTAAWFSGYPHGARAAEEEGAGNWGEIQVSETLRAEYRLGHEPPYMNHVFSYDPAACCGPGDGTSAPPGEVPTPEIPAGPGLEMIPPAIGVPPPQASLPRPPSAVNNTSLASGRPLQALPPTMMSPEPRMARLPRP